MAYHHDHHSDNNSVGRRRHRRRSTSQTSTRRRPSTSKTAADQRSDGRPSVSGDQRATSSRRTGRRGRSKFRRHQHQHKIDKVVDELFICSSRAVTVDQLRANSISLVISAAIEVPPPPNIPNTRTVHFDIDDLPIWPIHQHFDSCCEQIHEQSLAGGQTVIYCRYGISRSATMCLAYLVKYHRMSLRQAFTYLKSVRPKIRPNPGFMRQLIDFERRVSGRTSVAMISSIVGYIPDVYRAEAVEKNWRKAGHAYGHSANRKPCRR